MASKMLVSTLASVIGVSCGLVVPNGTPDVWGGPALGHVMGPSGFIFAFSGADGPTKEGSGCVRSFECACVCVCVDRQC